MREQCAVYAYLWVCTLLAGMNGYAAAGAAIGCCFYLAAPKATSFRERFMLTLFSWGMAYGGGVFFYGGPPPWNEKALFVAGGIGALIAVVFTALGYMVEKDGPVPEWIKTIIGLIPFFKSRGGNDGA